MIFFSFNKSRLATVWGGFSTEWYGRLLANDQVIAAALLSLRIALISATLATLLATMAGMALARFRRFGGRTLFSGLVSAPLIMPEVITGLSMLLLFVYMEQLIGWPNGRGVTTVTIAHTTFSLSYVAVSCARASSPWTSRSRRRRWISARSRPRCCSTSPC